MRDDLGRDLGGELGGELGDDLGDALRDGPGGSLREERGAEPVEEPRLPTRMSRVLGEEDLFVEGLGAEEPVEEVMPEVGDRGIASLRESATDAPDPMTGFAERRGAGEMQVFPVREDRTAAVERPQFAKVMEKPEARVEPMQMEAQPRTPLRILVLGATSGIAQQCQRLWAERGDALFLVARDGAKLAAVAADCEVRGGGLVQMAVADLDDTTGHAAVLAHAVNALGGLDLAVIAMGTLGDQAEAQGDFAAAAASLHTNFVAPVSLLTWLANYCTQRRAGTLAVFSSVAGDRGRKSNYIYGAGKAGLSAYLSGLRNRVDREGVRVVTIKPGPVRTAMTESMKGSSRFADAGSVAAAVVKALDGRADVVYVPAIWRVIMAVVRAVPERVFKGRDL